MSPERSVTYVSERTESTSPFKLTWFYQRRDFRLTDVHGENELTLVLG